MLLYILSFLFLIKATLLAGLKNKDACSYGYVQRFNMSEHGDFHPFVAECQMFVGDTGVFGTHDDAHGVLEVCLAVVIIAFFGGGNYLKAAVFQKLYGIQQIGFLAYGQGEQGSGRCFHSIRVDAYAVFGRNHDGIHSGTVTGTCYGSEVAHIGEPVQHDEERTFAFFEQSGNDVFYLLVSDGRYESHNTLMVLAGDAVDSFYGHSLHGDVLAFQGAEQFARQIALYVFFNEYFVYFFSGFYSFYDCSDTEYHFISFFHFLLFWRLVSI